MQEAEATRSEQASDTGNSKLVTSRSCPGFPVNSYKPITCSLNGKQLVINPQGGTFFYNRLAIVHHSYRCDHCEHRKHGKFSVHTTAESVVCFNIGRKAFAVRVALSAIVRPKDVATDHSQPICSFRRFRSCRHQHLPNRVSQISRHTLLFPRATRHRAAHKAWGD